MRRAAFRNLAGSQHAEGFCCPRAVHHHVGCGMVADDAGCRAGNQLGADAVTRNDRRAGICDQRRHRQSERHRRSVFLVGSVLSIFRQAKILTIDVEVPICVILIGVLMLAAQLAVIPLPKWFITLKETGEE